MNRIESDGELETAMTVGHEDGGFNGIHLGSYDGDRHGKIRWRVLQDGVRNEASGFSALLRSESSRMDK